MKKILIVEDDKNISKVVATRLRSWGYSVDAVYDASFATTKARDYEPDLILMDIGLPGGDGFTLAERMKEIDSISNVPIVYITASKKPGLEQKAMSMGAVAYIEKPFNSDQLLEAVTQATEV